MGQVTQQCIVSGQDLYHLYKDSETIVGALGHPVVVQGGCHPFQSLPTLIQQPVIKDSKTKSLLEAMFTLPERSGNKILLPNNNDLLDKYPSVW